MKKSVVVVVSLALAGSFMIPSCQMGSKKAAEEEVAPNTLTAEEVSQGFILMFDGQTPNGWRGYQLDSFPEKGWVIQDGTLQVIGSGAGEAGGKGGDIIFDRKFKDFHLKLEWKVSPKGNSGIFYLAQELEGEPIWKSAPEMQILCNVGHIDANLGVDGNRMAGSLYDLIPAKPQNAKPTGEWNKVEVMVFKGTVVHRMNGEVVLEYHIGTANWDNMIAGSKFKEFTEFGKYREGYIGLQDHGDDVWFRNIRIREL